MTQYETEHTVQAWSFQDTLFEWHCYPPGPAAELPPHVHDEYQICLSQGTPGEYLLRRSRHLVPVGSLSIIPPGQVHLAHDLEDRRTPAHYRLIYVPSDRLAVTAGQISGRPPRLPDFSPTVFRNELLATRLLRLHTASQDGSSRLELDGRLLSVLVSFILRHSDTQSPSKPGRERRAVQSIREYLDANYAEDVSLDQLARLVDLSPYYLARTFRNEVGAPPHAYLLGVRISRAKALLARGDALARVAAETGFADQSHFTRLFKRFVGTSPGRYRHNRKNVQDGSL